MIKILKIEFEKISKIKKFPSNLKRIFETSKSENKRKLKFTSSSSFISFPYSLIKPNPFASKTLKNYCFT